MTGELGTYINPTSTIRVELSSCVIIANVMLDFGAASRSAYHFLDYKVAERIADQQRCI